MSDIPRGHPRYFSLRTREKLSEAMNNGLVHETGLIAHGRGEAFDYLIGEKTIPIADMAEKATAAALLCAKNPVISVNGNVVALVGADCVKLAECIPAKLEVNLFHRTDGRLDKLVKELEQFGASEVFGRKGDVRIPGLDHDRGVCDKDGVFSADVVFVPLEDGDRCQALRDMKKLVIAVDLNPLSRTAKNANITVVDDVTRAVPNIEKWVKRLKDKDVDVVRRMVSRWDNDRMLGEVLSFISKRLNSLYG
jgi:4-phosphopantoate--beta-alanine ligase